MKTIMVDIDGILCNNTWGEYDKAIPNKQNIDKINKLYEKGNKIILWTGRGTVTGIDWKELTENQLKKWGVKYHELRFNKPDYDVFIDDKMMSIEDF